MESTANFANTCYETSQNIADFLSTVDWDTIESNALKLYQKYDQLNETEKGDLIAYAIGTYGTDIFVGSVALKCISSAKKLKEANAICNLEALIQSETTKESIISHALVHQSERNNFFKNIKLHVDRQNKHIPGKHNYEPHMFRSIVTHPDPEKLLKEFAGTGKPVPKKELGTSGYKEIVDFKEDIGFYIDPDTHAKIVTTKGTIHYSEKGAHIIPAHPESKLYLSQIKGE